MERRRGISRSKSVAQPYAYARHSWRTTGITARRTTGITAWRTTGITARRTTGITARQQRIRRRDKNGVPSQLRHRRYEAVFNNQRIGRRALRFVDNYMKDYYDDAGLWNRGRGRQYSEWRPDVKSSEDVE
jgi:hypothetical protein